jgi:hypothetical protein
MCEIVNFRHYRSIDELDLAFADRWLYIGRQNRVAGLPRSPLANPFRVRDYGRGQTIPLYRRWLWERIQNGDLAVMDALRTINEASVLVCWCRPGLCHGDVVKAAAAWLQSQDERS